MSRTGMVPGTTGSPGGTATLNERVVVAPGDFYPVEHGFEIRPVSASTGSRAFGKDGFHATDHTVGQAHLDAMRMGG